MAKASTTFRQDRSQLITGFKLSRADIGKIVKIAIYFLAKSLLQRELICRLSLFFDPSPLQLGQIDHPQMASQSGAYKKVIVYFFQVSFLY